jgi:UMF1 family MFS transporter
MNIDRQVFAWALYDWANSAFAVTVMAGFFPLFFKQYWAGNLSVTDSSYWLGMANGAAGLLVVLCAPLLGTLADLRSGHKQLLLGFALTAIVAVALLTLPTTGQWVYALLLYVVAVVAFSIGNLFYDALLPKVATKGQLEQVSSLGFALGYLGGGLLFALNVVMVSSPQTFALQDSAEGVRVAFFLTAIWWLFFSLPLWHWVPGQWRNARESRALHQSLQRLRATLARIRQLPETYVFLLAYWFYIDGVDTIVRMAVDYGLSLGFDGPALMQALLITQFVGFPAALLFGLLGQRWGVKPSLLLAVMAYLLILLFASQMRSVTEFYALAAAVGLVQGGIQALSRSLFARLTPPGHEGEFFGFYNMLGKFAVVMGPILMALVLELTGRPQIAILSIAPLFLLGAWLLLRVDVDKGEIEAAGFSITK